MEGYEAKPDHILLNGSDGIYELDDRDYVIGISIEVLSDSDTMSMKYGLGESALVPISLGEGARGYGGFHVCGVPCYYKGSVNWKFDDGGSGKALLIITKLFPTAKKVL